MSVTIVLTLLQQTVRPDRRPFWKFTESMPIWYLKCPGRREDRETGPGIFFGGPELPEKPRERDTGDITAHGSSGRRQAAAAAAPPPRRHLPPRPGGSSRPASWAAPAAQAWQQQPPDLLSSTPVCVVGRSLSLSRSLRFLYRFFAFNLIFIAFLL